jgi:hypothetical protein
MVSLSGSARDVLAVAHDLELRGYERIRRVMLRSVNGRDHADSVTVPVERRHLVIIAGSVIRTGATLR